MPISQERPYRTQESPWLTMRLKYLSAFICFWLLPPQFRSALTPYSFRLHATLQEVRRESLNQPHSVTAERDEKEPVKQEESTSGEISSDKDDIDTPVGGEPNAREQRTLKRVGERLPWAVFLVAIIELCERFTYYGCQGTFQNYIQKPYEGSLGTGGLGMKHMGATGLTTFYQFWCYVTPLAGGLIADQYLGKYKTILCSAGIYMAGLLILVCTAIPQSLSNGAGEGGFVASIILTGIGTGGIKANVAPLIAEQYTRRHMEIKLNKKGERVIIDPYITVQHIYMMFYWSINIGALSLLATPCKMRDLFFFLGQVDRLTLIRYGTRYWVLECLRPMFVYVHRGNHHPRPWKEDLCRPPPKWYNCGRLVPRHWNYDPRSLLRCAEAFVDCRKRQKQNSQMG